MVVWVVVSGFFAWMCLHYGVDITAVFDLAQRIVYIERRHLIGTATTIIPFGKIASVGPTRYPDEYGGSSYLLEMHGKDGSRHMLSTLMGNLEDSSAVLAKIEAETELPRKDREASLADTFNALKKLIQRCLFVLTAAGRRASLPRTEMVRTTRPASVQLSHAYRHS